MACVKIHRWQGTGQPSESIGSQSHWLPATVTEEQIKENETPQEENGGLKTSVNHTKVTRFKYRN